MKRPVLVTGASGFVGRHVCAALRDSGIAVRGTTRRADSLPQCDELIRIGGTGPYTRWQRAVDQVDAVVHLAAVTHDGVDRASSDLLHEVNVAATVALAREAVAAGVRRFVFMSSIKVNGEASPRVAGEPLRLHGGLQPAPQDAYGHSKLEAERALLGLAGLDVVVLRPPLVYGAGQKGNLDSLARAMRRGIPLPFSAIHNRRSLIGVENLADAVVAAVLAEAPVERVLTLADCELSTPALARAMGDALGIESRLWPLPPWLLRGGASLLGRGALAARLTGDLVVDSTAARATLDWSPRLSVEEGLSGIGAARKTLAR